MTTKKKENEVKKLICSCCGKELVATSSNFYKSSSRIYRANGICGVCKTCILKLCKELSLESNDVETGIYRLCLYLDMPFLKTPFDSSVDETSIVGDVEEDCISVFKKYIKNINSLRQYTSYTFENGDTIDKSKMIEEEIKEYEESLTDRDKQNENDVIRILGYDPFETENTKDRKYLFNRLVDMLDDSTLEDNIKLMSVIEIVKGFNQVDKINEIIASVTQDLSKLSSNSGGIKSLIDTKKNLMTTVLKIAEDNGISTKFNTNKSKGSGTLSGTMKKLNEIGLEEAQVNLFDIQTAQGMKQVADLSHKSIIEQLVFDENEYTEMIAFQRTEMGKLNDTKDKLEEENRKLKIELSKFQKEENKF